MPAFSASTPAPKTHVFVSYSHADTSLVAPIVKLLRVNRSLVFQDTDGIRPGKRWRREIARGLSRAHLVVVFWCGHASRSEEVFKEWKAALEQDKDVLPLLLDATPLPAELAEFQWIDFRETVGPDHCKPRLVAAAAPAAAPPPEAAPARSRHGFPLSGIAAVVVASVALSLFMLNGREAIYGGRPGPAGPVVGVEDPGPVVAEPAPDPGPGEPGPTSIPAPVGPSPLPAPAPVTAPGEAARVPGFWLAAGPALAVVLGAVWLWRRRDRGEVVDGPPAGPIERRIATEIETEIFRRRRS